MEGASASGNVYHERQRLQFCLLHALNNLLQGKDKFTRNELNKIAEDLSKEEVLEKNWVLFPLVKPHHNVITGNYDANVLFAALASRGKEVLWYDKRKGVSGLDFSVYGSSLVGIIVNLYSRRYLGMWKSRHWVAICHVDGVWYNLDSDLLSPRPFHEGEIGLKRFLDAILGDEGEVFLVVDKVIQKTS